ESVVVIGPSQDAAEFAGRGSGTVAAQFKDLSGGFVRIGCQRGGDRAPIDAGQIVAVFADVHEQALHLIDAGHRTVGRFAQFVVECGALAHGQVTRVLDEAAVEVNAAPVNDAVDDLYLSLRWSEMDKTWMGPDGATATSVFGAVGDYPRQLLRIEFPMDSFLAFSVFARTRHLAHQ